MDRSAIVSLKEKRANLWEEQKALLTEVTARAADGGESFSAEENEKYERMDSDMESLSTQIERAERLLDSEVRDAAFVEQREEETGVNAEQYDEVFRTYLRAGAAGLSPEQRSVLMEKRAQGITTPAGGGYTAPDGFWNRVVEVQKAFGGVSSVAEVINTADGNTLPWMTNDDTANEGAILAEHAQVTEQDTTFGTASLGSYVYTSKLIRVSYQLLQDTEIDLEGFLARKLAMRLARIHGRHQTTGTGSNQPLGIVTGASTGVTAASATAIEFNELLDLIDEVDPSYLSNAGFMVHRKIVTALRKVTDNDGRPIWQPSLEAGSPDRLHGYGYTVNENMASTIAATNTTALFGDFREGYVIRNVKGASVVRLDEKYAENLQVGYFMYDRQDSTVQNTGAYKALVQP